MTAPATSEPTAAAIAVGQRVGKYLLTEKLGEGAMGTVFAGTHETLGRAVAIKFLRGDMARDETLLARFQQEAQAVSRIGHANIVAVYDFGRLADGTLYYVMERIEGETVTARLRRPPPLGDEQLLSLFGQMCRALQAAHAQRVVHRDLKPDNVLLQPQPDGEPHVKIVDFGVAKMRDPGAGPGAGPGDDEGGGLTHSGTILGTPTYMAPEQITDPQGVDGRADIYALGAMLYEALTGEPPFGRGDLMETMRRHISELPAPPSTRATRPVPAALDAVVLRALAKYPDERFPDAVSFLAALRAALGGGETRRSPGAAGAARPVGGPRARSRLTILVGAGAAVAALALVGIGSVAMRGRPARTAGPAGQADRAQRLQVLRESPLEQQANRELGAALSADALQRRLAVDAMAEVGDRSALAQVITALGDDNPEVRRGAANAAALLARPEDQELRSALAAAAARSGGQVAVDLAAARFKAGDPTAEEDLRRAIEQRDPVSRLRAAVALAGAGKVAAPVLRACIAGAPQAVKRRLRWAAYVRLYQLGDAAFIAELQKAIDGADPVARLDAAQTLARAGEERGRLALADLAVHSADPVDRVDAAAVLAEMTDVGAVKTLVGELDSALPAVRSRAATSLGRLVPLLPAKDELAARLQKLLADREAAPRIAAAAALLALEDARGRRTP